MGKAKRVVFGGVLGSMALLGGCFEINWQSVLMDTVLYAGQEFVFDNDLVFDMWQDTAD